MSAAGHSAGGFINDLTDAARRNPVSAALIGMGVVWLFAGKSSARAGAVWRTGGVDRLPDVTRDTLSSIAAGASEGVRAAGDAAGASLGAVRDTGAHVVNKAADLVQTLPSPATVFGSARDNLGQLLNAQPLALGAIGMAIGAGIAAVLPVTGMENAYLGEASDNLRSPVGLAGQQVIERAANVAARVVDATTDEARNQGLTPEGVKTAADNLVGRLNRVVHAGRAGASAAANESKISSPDVRPAHERLI